MLASAQRLIALLTRPAGPLAVVLAGVALAVPGVMLVAAWVDGSTPWDALRYALSGWTGRR